MERLTVVIEKASRSSVIVDLLVLALLGFDAAILAFFEVFFLPLRFDGTLLPDLGSAPFPITALVAGITMPWLISRAARLSWRLTVIGIPLWIWLITIIALGLTDSTENLVLLQDWRTILLLAAGTIPAAVVLGRAQARQHA